MRRLVYRIRALSLSLGVLMLLLGTHQFRPVVSAQPMPVETPSADTVGYQQVVEQAVREFGAQHYQESRALFHQAHALFPSARTHRGIALAAFEMRDYAECITNLEAALKSDVKPLTPELRSDSERLLARAKTFVAQIVVQKEPSKSRLMVDGAPVDARADDRLLLSIGGHTLEVIQEGFISELRRISVNGGEQRTISITLSAKASIEQSAEKKRWYKSPWLWGTLGVLVAGAAAGTAVALTRDDQDIDDGSAGFALKGP